MLSGDKAQRQRLDQLLVARIAEAVEEEQGQRQFVGEIAGRNFRPQEIGGFLNNGIVGRHASFQQGVGWQRTLRGQEAAIPVHPPFEIAALALGALEERDALVDGLVDLGLLFLRQRQRIGGGGRGTGRQYEDREEARMEKRRRRHGSSSRGMHSIIEEAFAEKKTIPAFFIDKRYGVGPYFSFRRVLASNSTFEGGTR